MDVLALEWVEIPITVRGCGFALLASPVTQHCRLCAQSDWERHGPKE